MSPPLGRQLRARRLRSCSLPFPRIALNRSAHDILKPYRDTKCVTPFISLGCHIPDYGLVREGIVVDSNVGPFNEGAILPVDPDGDFLGDNLRNDEVLGAELFARLQARGVRSHSGLDRLSRRLQSLTLGDPPLHPREEPGRSHLGPACPRRRRPGLSRATPGRVAPVHEEPRQGPRAGAGLPARRSSNSPCHSSSD